MQMFKYKTKNIFRVKLSDFLIFKKFLLFPFASMEN